MITVVIPCYNDNDIVGRAVQSALKQGGGAELEVVIVDDGSDVPVVDTSGDSRVRIVRHDSNRGLPTALNTGIEAGRGDRLVILASDDELAPGYMRHMTPVDADIVSCDMLAGGKRVKAKPGSLNDLIVNNCHSYAAMFKRWVFDATGGFKATMNPSWEDWEFWLNAAKLGAKWQHVSRPLHVYHRRSDGRDAEAQTKEVLLWSKLMGYHQDLYGAGRGVVTFIVPNYAHEEYLAEAVQSVLDQVYPHVNVVVVNDGSPGDVEAALIEGVGQCDRLTLLNQPNRHLSAARNAGIRYALSEYQSEFLIMLDADDEVDPNFVEDALSVIQRVKEYIYTDITLIGDAFHVLPMEDWDCKKLAEKHLHPCTFLMYADMWRDVNVSRGFGYDESMKRGWEDWEFSLAALEAGYCGRRMPGGYFHYRIHADGSMRTDADKWSGELSNYIKTAHPWMSHKKAVVTMCKTCGSGGGRYSNVVGSSGGASVIFVPNVGEFRPDEVLAARYTGSTTSTMTKQGAIGQVYRYSGDDEKQKHGYGPIFTFFARDAHLFVGPFDIRRVDPGLKAQLENVKLRGPQLPSLASSPVPAPTVSPAPKASTPPASQRQVEVVKFSEPRQPRGDTDLPVSRIPGGLTVEEAQGMLDKEAPPGMAVRGQELEPEDYTQVKGIGPIGHNALVAAGYSVYEDVVSASSTELSVILKITEKKADVLKASTEALIAELEEDATD